MLASSFDAYAILGYCGSLSIRKVISIVLSFDCTLVEPDILLVSSARL